MNSCISNSCLKLIGILKIVLKHQKSISNSFLKSFPIFRRLEKRVLEGVYFRVEARCVSPRARGRRSLPCPVKFPSRYYLHHAVKTIIRAHAERTDRSHIYRRTVRKEGGKSWAPPGGPITPGGPIAPGGEIARRRHRQEERSPGGEVTWR